MGTTAVKIPLNKKIFGILYGNHIYIVRGELKGIRNGKFGQEKL